MAIATIATRIPVILALACLVTVPAPAIANLYADGPREITEGPFQRRDTLRIGSNTVHVRTTGRITKLRGYHPTFSPDGRLIVYCAPKSEGDIRSDLMISRDGGKTAEPLVETDSIKYRPMFSPDGRYIAYTESWNEPNQRGDGVVMLWLYDLETNQRTQITPENRRAVLYVGSSKNYD
jgi:Tol biopolymer transport system component